MTSERVRRAGSQHEHEKGLMIQMSAASCRNVLQVPTSVGTEPSYTALLTEFSFPGDRHAVAQRIIKLLFSERGKIVWCDWYDVEYSLFRPGILVSKAED
jgi:type II secretory pathway predicted ATPase ExeA